MASTICQLDMATIYLGDDRPNDSQHFVIESIKLPSLEEETKEVKPGGHAMSMNMRTKNIKPIVLGFNLTGVQPENIDLFLAPRRQRYTIRGNLYDMKSQEDKKVVCVIEGRMTKLDMGDYKKDDGVTTEYEINEVVLYKVSIDGQEKAYFEFFGGPAAIRINGTKVFGRAARNLGLGT